MGDIDEHLIEIAIETMIKALKENKAYIHNNTVVFTVEAGQEYLQIARIKRLCFCPIVKARLKKATNEIIKQFKESHNGRKQS